MADWLSFVAEPRKSCCLEIFVKERGVEYFPLHTCGLYEKVNPCGVVLGSA